MARRCGCASDECSCLVIAGDGIQVNGTGSERNPYVITSEVSAIETGFDVQVNNSVVATDVHGIDFRGTGVTVAAGVDEVVVTVPGASGGGGTTITAGSISMYGGNVAPTGWTFCNGDTLLIADQPALFGAISNIYGGDGTTTFKVPDLRDRFPIGASATKTPGMPPVSTTGVGGSATKALAPGNIPSHFHTINHDHGAANSSSVGDHDHSIQSADNPGGTNSLVARGGGTWFARSGPIQGAGGHFHSVNLGNFAGNSGSTGSGTAFDVMPPWLAINFIIKL